jgi:hypothetical protein
MAKSYNANLEFDNWSQAGYVDDDQLEEQLPFIPDKSGRKLEVLSRESNSGFPGIKIKNRRPKIGWKISF